MEGAKIGLPFRQLLRNADPGTDPNTLTASTVSRRGAANEFTGSDNAQLHAVSDPGAVARFGSSTEPFDPLEPESGARLPSPSPRGRLANTAIILFFMALLFLGGIYLGASLTANLPSRAAPAGGSVSMAIPAPIETPAAGSSATADPTSEPLASPPSQRNMTAAEAAPVTSSSATALPGNGAVTPEMGSTPTPTPTPASEEPMARAPPAPAGSLADAPTPSETVTSTPPPIAPARTSAATPDQADLSDLQRQALLLRGDAFFSAGDVTSARLFYQRGSDAGDGTAALRLGETFDAAFLERAGLSNVRSDPKKAVYWYRRARDLGSAEAEILLKSLQGN
jgi:hypothetical protein